MTTTDAGVVLKKILAVTEKLAHFKDLDAVLDHILFEARSFTRADAGSIYLLEDGGMSFSYVQNDTLFKPGASNRYLYSKAILPLDHLSIAGHVALSGEPLRIHDVGRLSEEVPYSFNTDFDVATGYRTRSMLTVPLVNSEDRTVGVMSLINALDEEVRVVDFTDQDELFATTLAYQASVAIERAIMNREMILRMLATSRLRDPMETGPHVNRVGAYSAEIYQHWAVSSGVPYNEMRRIRDTLRLAAMLHDIGKVAISDLILKKPGKLTSQEFDIIKTHTVYGARLFAEGTSDLDRMSLEIALNHHERWDGQGYPGKLDNLHLDPIVMGKGKNQENLSLLGSIVAIADVYDALSVQRCYKDPWPQDKVLEEIKKQSGSQFHPELVATFFAIYDVIDAIRQRYSEEQIDC